MIKKNIIVLYTMELPDQINFDLIYQNNPKTYNNYDRNIIHDDIELTFPTKIKINNVSDAIRGKTFVHFPPRKRAVMIKGIDELEAQRFDKYGIKVDTGFNNLLDKLKRFQMKLPMLLHDGSVDPRNLTELVSLSDIINDYNPIRQEKRIFQAKQYILVNSAEINASLGIPPQPHTPLLSPALSPINKTESSFITTPVKYISNVLGYLRSTIRGTSTTPRTTTTRTRHSSRSPSLTPFDSPPIKPTALSFDRLDDVDEEKEHEEFWDKF